jgi:hypothetical protein
VNKKNTFAESEIIKALKGNLQKRKRKKRK